MAESFSSSAAEGYKQASFSVQKRSGEEFIQADVCPQVGDVILDLGCGTGELSAYLAEVVGAEGKVIAVDPDKERIQLARQSHGHMKNLSFAEGSSTNFLRMGSNAYDIVFCNFALHWMPEKQQVFNDMFSSLKVGGKIALYYNDHIPTFMMNAFKELNLEKVESISQMYHTGTEMQDRAVLFIRRLQNYEELRVLQRTICLRNRRKLSELALVDNARGV